MYLSVSPVPTTASPFARFTGASILLVLVSGADNVFEVDTWFWSSLSCDAAVAGVSMVAVGAEGVAAGLLSDAVDGNAAPLLCALFWSTSLYRSSLLEELVESGKGKGFTYRGSTKATVGC
jgi:hypothetical protein